MRTLRRKFAVLVLLVGVGVVLVEAVAVWGILTLQREIAWPMHSMETVLRGLHQTKRNANDLAIALGTPRWSEPGTAPAPGPIDPTRANSLAEDLARNLAELDKSESYLIRSGVGSTRTLRTHIESAVAAAKAASQESSHATDAVRNLARATDLIDRIESHVLGDSNFQIDHAERMRTLILLVAAACFAALILAVCLGAILFGRWVLLPIGDLRLAAERIGSGDYSHRIRPRGKDELASLSAEVNQMAETIARMTEDRIERERLATVGAMVQRVAHNLRNPLAGIRSLAEVTHAELPPSSDLREIQSRIMSTVDRFEEWLKDLIRTTRPIEIVTTPLDLVEWIPGVIEPLRPLAQIKRLDIRISVPAHPIVVPADARHLEQALVAVVTNAIQASPEQTPIDITISPAPPAGATIRVHDRGPGVPEDLRLRIFQPYFTTKPTGTGIGLALARHVIHQHRGAITIENPVSDTGGTLPSDPGATFVISLPTHTD